MIRAAFVLLAIAAGPSPRVPQQQCPDVTACRAAALDAAARGEFETFHDLAWRAVQKGQPNDPELMLLLARAQSLSGRPGDALVMIRRLAERGPAPDVRTSDDFRRVRALPGWAEVEALLNVEAPGTSGGPETVRTPEPPLTAAAPTAAATPSAPATAAAPPSGSSSTRASGKPAASAPAALKAPASGASRVEAAWANDELRVSGASLATIGLAHDSVSRRFIVGDPAANKLVVVDEVFNRVNDLIGAASGGFFGLRALEIDRRRGDLWVANSGDQRRPSVHKLQLVSGRVLFELPLPAGFGDAFFEDLAVAPSGAVLLLDSRGGRLLRVPAGTRVYERAAKDAALQGARSIALVDDRVAYVALEEGLVRVDQNGAGTSRVAIAGGTRLGRNALQGLARIRWYRGALIGVQAEADGACRIVRIALNRAGTRAIKAEVLDAHAQMPDPTAAALDDGVLFYLTQEGDASIVRRIALP